MVLIVTERVISTVNLLWDLKLIATKGFSTVSYTENVLYRKWVISYKKMQKKKSKKNYHILQQGVSQLYPAQINVFYNILKVPQNSMRGKHRK